MTQGIVAVVTFLASAIFAGHCCCLLCFGLLPNLPHFCFICSLFSGPPPALTTNLSLIISSCNSLYEQCSAKQNRFIMKSSTVLSCNCLSKLNFTHSNNYYISSLYKVNIKLIFDHRILFLIIFT